MKWAGVAKSFGPTLTKWKIIYNIIFDFVGRKKNYCELYYIINCILFW